jgi:hypothetical protein
MELVREAVDWINLILKVSAGANNYVYIHIYNEYISI